jgi:hypothetical protein
MTEQFPPTFPTPSPKKRRSGGLVAGLILILVGLMALADNIPGLDIGLVFLPGLGLIFLGAGYINRKIGLVIPGGILMGIGLGAVLTDGLKMGDTTNGGAFMLAFGAGWGLITLVSILMGQRINWPLYPGGILAAFGLFLIISSWLGMDLSLVFLPALGVTFLVSGILTRKIGLLIPGGILVGIGAGAILMEKVVRNVGGEAQGGYFLLAFAAGWVLITLSALLIKSWTWWPLIPGGVLALVGWALLAGQKGLEMLKYANYVWPVILIVVGLFLLLRRRDTEK